MVAVGNWECAQGAQLQQTGIFAMLPHFGEISVQYFSKHSLRIFRETLHVGHDNYCETCAIIETFGKDVRYVKYVKY